MRIEEEEEEEEGKEPPEKGKLFKNIQRHEVYCASTPPRMGSTAAATTHIVSNEPG